MPVNLRSPSCVQFYFSGLVSVLLGSEQAIAAVLEPGDNYRIAVLSRGLLPNSVLYVSGYLALKENMGRHNGNQMVTGEYGG